MGDKITQALQSADLLRARFLKEALRRGSHALSSSGHEPLVRGESTASNRDGELSEIHKASLEQLVECVPEAITVLDTSYHITRINGEFTRVFGFKPEEAVGRRIDSLIVPADRQAETRWIGESLAKGQRLSLETKRQRKDGTLIDVSLSTKAVVVNNTQVAVYVLYRDITEQKKAEALSATLYRIAEKTSSLEDLKQFYSSIHAIVGEVINARNFYIAMYDAPSHTLTFPYFVDESDEVPQRKRPGRGLTEYVLRTGEPLLCTPEVFEELVRQEEVELIGSPSLDWLGVPLKNSTGVFGALVVQSYSDGVRFTEWDRDILTFVSRQMASAMEHRRNEEALRRSELRYRSLVQSAVYGIYRSSLDGKFLDVNPALIAMLGYGSSDEVLALEPKQEIFVDPTEQTRLMTEFQRKGRLDNIEVRWKRKDGNSITVRLSGRAVSGEEDVHEVLELIAEDVTERRVLEDQFRQAQKMEAVGRLAGGVAHDFNNLLMVISGYTEVLLEHACPDDPLYQKMAAIQQAADRATTLTRQLLAFSRKQLLELKVVDVNAIVVDMERLLRPLIGEDIELVTRLAPDLGRTRADAGQIEQVLMNLVVNSKDAMPTGGKIVVQTGNVRLDDDYRREHAYIQPGPYVMMSVSDTGHGMDKETQSRIFEPFFTTKEKGKGTGLGLSTVYGIIKQSGGYIFAQSELGKGTTFRIYLPRVEDAAEPHGRIANTAGSARGTERVLLVEDEESVRQLVRETLEAKGYTVMEAENGDDAIEIAQQHAGAIQILITDVVMPGMSGRELAKRLTSSCSSMRVLYLSGYTEDAIVHQGEAAPGTAFLQKPFTLQVLSRKVRELLDSAKQ